MILKVHKDPGKLTADKGQDADCDPEQRANVLLFHLNGSHLLNLIALCAIPSSQPPKLGFASE